MNEKSIGAILEHIRGLAAMDSLGHLTNAQLLTRFLESQEAGAFSVLLHRHGSMVWRVCQRVLHHRQDTEDAFQATFLTLVRSAPTIRKHDSLAAWLHGVAFRLSRRLQQEKARREAVGSQIEAVSSGDSTELACEREVQAVFDEELNRLAEKYRMPLVLCCLEGKTRDEAAEQLGWSLGTFKRRLDAGRKLLADRLTQRGVTLGLTLFAAVIAQDSVQGAVPLVLTSSTLKAATIFATGGATTGIVSGPVAILVEGMVKSLSAARATLPASLVAILIALAGGTGIWTASADQKRNSVPVVTASLDGRTTVETEETETVSPIENARPSSEHEIPSEPLILRPMPDSVIKPARKNKPRKERDDDDKGEHKEKKLKEKIVSEAGNVQTRRIKEKEDDDHHSSEHAEKERKKEEAKKLKGRVVGEEGNIPSRKLKEKEDDDHHSSERAERERKKEDERRRREDR